MRVVVVRDGGGKREDGVEERRDLGIGEAAEGDEGVVFGSGVIASIVVVVVRHTVLALVEWTCRCS